MTVFNRSKSIEFRSISDTDTTSSGLQRLEMTGQSPWTFPSSIEFQFSCCCSSAQREFILEARQSSSGSVVHLLQLSLSDVGVCEDLQLGEAWPVCQQRVFSEKVCVFRCRRGRPPGVIRSHLTNLFESECTTIHGTFPAAQRSIVGYTHRRIRVEPS